MRPHLALTTLALALALGRGGFIALSGVAVLNGPSSAV